MNSTYLKMKGFTPDWIHDPQQVEAMQTIARELAKQAEELQVNWKPIAKGREIKDLPEIIARMRSAINWAEIKRMEVANDDEARRLGVDAIIKNVEISKKVDSLDW